MLSVGDPLTIVGKGFTGAVEVLYVILVGDSTVAMIY
jgi:hypothetical protein